MTPDELHEAIKNAIRLLYVHGIITDSEREKATRRFRNRPPIRKPLID